MEKLYLAMFFGAVIGWLMITTGVLLRNPRFVASGIKMVAVFVLFQLIILYLTLNRI